MSKKDQIAIPKKKDREVNPYDFTICPNCGATEVGKFCPECGQSNKDFNRPIKEIIGDLAGSINFDTRILNTIKPFFLKPGFLSQEYFKGRRQRYVPPMRLYLFFSVVFFFFAQYFGSKMINNIKFNNVSIDSTDHGLAFGTSLTINDSLEFVQARDSLNSIISNEILNDSTASEGTKKAILGGMNISKNKEAFLAKFLKTLSYVLFLLMPVFALILALILWRSRLLYVKHLVFSINFHSFIFGLTSLVIVLFLILPDKVADFSLYLLWGIPIYLMVGINRFYNRKMIGAFFKAIGAIMMYWFVIAIVFIILVYFTAQEFA